MVRKKLDERIRTLLERSVYTSERSMLLIVGDHGKDQVPNLHHILTKCSVRARPKVLWCYKKELGFSTHRKKRMKQLKRDKARGLAKSGSNNDADPTVDNFELFVSGSDIEWCYYRDTARVLGTTVGMLVLQDFEALTPNLMARTIETVEGGGLIVFLLRTVASLKQLYALSMDVHARYRTESSGDVVPRFNERFLLSLAGCRNCLVCDDELNVLPLSRRALRSLGGSGAQRDGDGDGDGNVNGSSSSNNAKKRWMRRIQRGDGGEVIRDPTEDDEQLSLLKTSLRDTPHVGAVIELAKTLDQARAVLTFLEACSERGGSGSGSGSDNHPPTAALSRSTSTVALTAARGRGKSAAVGLCLAGAISLGYANVVVTAPEPENLVSVFDFLMRGLKVLKYQRHLDYDVSYELVGGSGEGGAASATGGGGTGRGGKSKVVSSVIVHRDHRQVVRYLRPGMAGTEAAFASAEIVAIDEAAAIPLPVVRKLVTGGGSGSGGMGCGDRIAFLSSTVNGYEGTGRALSLKLVKELRDGKGTLGDVPGGMGGAEAAARSAAKAIAGPKSGKGEAKVHEKRWAAAAEAASAAGGGGGSLREIELTSPIRYAQDDPIETWLNRLLCLDCGSAGTADARVGKGDGSIGTYLRLEGGAPAPSECELYSVDRDALFSYHSLSESFLQKVMALYTSAHYKNSPNDLQMLSDAPAHSLFVLLSPSAEREEEDKEKSRRKKKKKRSKKKERDGDDFDDDDDVIDELPDVLAVAQVALEGNISRKSVQAQLARGHRSAGDLIPWTISQQFGDSNFARLSGARIVRIAVHPSLQGMGYGSRVVDLLFRFYNGDLMSLVAPSRDEDGDEEKDGGGEEDDSDGESDDDDDDDDEDHKRGGGGTGPESRTKLLREKLNPRKELPPLLLPLSESDVPPRLDWLGTSFGLTEELHRFWRDKAGMRTLYLRQTKNDLTGEHSSILIRSLPRTSGYDGSWLPAFVADARRRFASLLSGPFRDLGVALASSLLAEDGGPATVADADGGDGSGSSGGQKEEEEEKEDAAAKEAIRRRSGMTSGRRITASDLNLFLTPHDLKRLEQYGRNLCDHHLITDLLPTVARLYFMSRLGPDVRLSSLQAALLCGIGLQHKTVDVLTSELGLPTNQVLAMFNKAVRKLSIALNGIVEEDERSKLLGGKARADAERKVERMKDVVRQTLEEDAEEGAKAAMATLEGETTRDLPPEITDNAEIMQYAIKGTDKEWEDALRDRDITNGNQDEEEGEGKGAIVQIKARDETSTATTKRKLNDEDIMREGNASDPKSWSTKKKKKKNDKSNDKNKRKESRRSKNVTR